MNNTRPFTKQEIANDKMSFDWQFGGSKTNTILENKEMNVRLLRYLVVSNSGRILYDTFTIRESINNSVILVRNQSRELGLIWEWRPIPEKWFWACPRGFGDPGDEDNIATAKREMIEEIGNCKIQESKKIGSLYQNTSFYENPVGLVLVDVQEVEKQVRQEEGVMDFKFYSKEELLTMIREHKIEDTFTLSAIMKFFALDGF